MSPTIIAHRGASGREFENSRAAFALAVELGADGVELDVHSTSDGIILVHHDAELQGLGPIGHLSYMEMQEFRLPNGEPVPTLPEVLDILGDLDVYVEVKTLSPAFDPSLLSVLDQGPAPSRYAVHGFDHRIIARLGALKPGLPRGILLSSYPLDPVALMRSAGAGTIWQDHGLLDAAMVSAVHGARGKLIAWTVNQPRDARALTRLGVDGLCGNYPDRLRAAVKEIH
ncbi:MAG TPA: glycerophosphodiester phosphodiesterase [Gemmatimonadales bacterium]|jgi:glycerophosphoryl diester phosphodiesterase|nr:glycerophosphodiester phosphodiesterase [Gemmatimonadales bacterium]